MLLKTFHEGWRNSLCTGTHKSLVYAFMGVGRIALDKERLVLSKPVAQFSFTYGTSRGLCIFVYTQESQYIMV